MSRRILALLAVVALMPGIAMASSEPVVEPRAHTEVRAATVSFIEANTFDGVYRYFDVDSGELLELELKMLHPLIGKCGELYVARADFFDGQGRPVDMRFLVVRDAGRMRAFQAVAHKVGASHRPLRIGVS